MTYLAKPSRSCLETIKLERYISYSWSLVVFLQIFLEQTLSFIHSYLPECNRHEDRNLMGFGRLFPSSYSRPDTESAPKMDCWTSKCIWRNCTRILQRCSQSLRCVVHGQIPKGQNRSAQAVGGRPCRLSDR